MAFERQTANESAGGAVQVQSVRNVNFIVVVAMVRGAIKGEAFDRWDNDHVRLCFALASWRRRYLGEFVKEPTKHPIEQADLRGAQLDSHGVGAPRSRVSIISKFFIVDDGCTQREGVDGRGGKIVLQANGRCARRCHQGDKQDPDIVEGPACHVILQVTLTSRATSSVAKTLDPYR